MTKRITGAKARRRGAKPTPGLRLREPAATQEKAAAGPIREIMLAFAAEQPEALFLEAFGPLKRQARRRCEGSTQQWPQNFAVRLSGRCSLACDYCFDSANRAPLDHLDRPTAQHIADSQSAPLQVVPGTVPRAWEGA
jgi:hypothetical protein